MSTTNGDTLFWVVLEQDPLGSYMGKLVPPPPILMLLNPNINSDSAVGAVNTEFLRARALKLNPSYPDVTVSDLNAECIF